MRIAIFTDVFLEVPGGIPSSIRAQKKGLEALGHEVMIFAPGFSSSLEGLSAVERRSVVLVPTHKLLRVNGAPLSKRPELVEREVLRRFPGFEFDLVHVHYEASCSIAGMLLARKFKRPLLQTMHGREDMAVQINVPLGLKSLVACVLNFLHGRYIPHKVKVVGGGDLAATPAPSLVSNSKSSLAPTFARRKMWELMVNHANFADKVITPSRHFAKKLIVMGVSRPIEVVSNGVDDEMVKAVKVNLRELKKGEPLKLFWNSRLSNEKRIMPFLRALRLMREPYFCSFVGDGNALSKAKRFAKKHKLNVKFYGRVAHGKVLDMMLEQDLSVTVSYGFDTQGLTLLEAEATGMPVFFCDSDMREVVPAGSFVMAKGLSAEEMAVALDVVAKEPERIREMSQVMLKHRSEVLQSAQIKNLIGVYESVLRQTLR